MSCPKEGVIGKILTFTIRAKNASGSPVDTDSRPTYKVYRKNKDNPIVTGRMSKLDDNDTTGLYEAQLNLTTANKFYIYNTYTIDIKAEIGGTSVATTYSFLAVGVERE